MSKVTEVEKDGIMMKIIARQTIPRRKQFLARIRNKKKSKLNPNIKSLSRRILKQGILLQLRATKQAIQRLLRRPRSSLIPKNKRA
jgi:hypothetical protein